VIGSGAAPYENQLAAQCGVAANYTGIGTLSLPNYIGAVSGSTQGISDNNPRIRGVSRVFIVSWRPLAVA
jgi:hypothetical protein